MSQFLSEMDKGKVERSIRAVKIPPKDAAESGRRLTILRCTPAILRMIEVAFKQGADADAEAGAAGGWRLGTLT